MDQGSFYIIADEVYVTTPDGITASLAQRVKENEAEMLTNLNATLYGDDAPIASQCRLSFREWLFKWEWRFRDAWQVLRGKADIC